MMSLSMSFAEILEQRSLHRHDVLAELEILLLDDKFKLRCRILVNENSRLCCWFVLMTNEQEKCYLMIMV
jgi:hypothetical protein